MGLLKKYCESIQIYLYDTTEKVLDDNGYETGEEKITYKTPFTVTAHVSTNKGTAQSEVFGTLDNFDKVILLDRVGLGVDENSRIVIGADTYRVNRVAESLYYTNIAVTKVKVS